MNKKVLGAVGLGVIGISIGLCTFLEYQKDKLLEVKIAEIETQYNTQISMETSSYNYFTDTLTLSSVSVSDQKIDEMVFTNPRTKPDEINLTITGLHFPVDIALDFLKSKNIPSAKIDFVKSLAKGKNDFLINADVHDISDTANGSVSSSFNIGIQNILSIGSDISISKIPLQVLDNSESSTYFKEMTPQKQTELMGIIINPSNIHIETKGLSAYMKTYLIETDFKTEENFTLAMDRGIENGKKDRSTPPIITGAIVDGVKALKEGKEIYISLNSNKAISIGDLFQNMFTLKAGSASDIDKKLGISLITKTL